MKDNGKQFWVTRDAENNARHVMGAVVVIVLTVAVACVLLMTVIFTSGWVK